MLARDDAGNAFHLLVLAEIRIPDVVPEPGRMREQVAQRDRATGRARARLAARIEPFEHLGSVDFGDDFRSGGVEIELALLDELHGAR